MLEDDWVIECRQAGKVYRAFERPSGPLGLLTGFFRKTVKEHVALRGVDLRVRRGEMVGLIGANGAGKTTLVKCLTGIIPASEGSARLLGRDCFALTRAEKRQLALVMGQRSQLWWDIPAIDSFRLLKEIYGLTEAQYRERMTLFDRVLGLNAYLHQPVRKLSLGERMRCDLAASLLHRPPLLFLDEPTIGLDIVAKANVREFLQEINRREGTTVLLTTHDLADIETLCRRVIVIDHGRLLFDGALNELRDRILPVTAIVFDVKRAPDASELAFDGWQIREVGLHRYRLDVDRRKTAPATAVKEIVNRFEVSDLQIEEPEIEEVVKRIYQKGVA